LSGILAIGLKEYGNMRKACVRQVQAGTDQCLTV